MSKQREAFTFYKSFNDVYMELSDRDKVLFMDALLNRQFNGIEPTLKGMANFAYLSQKHSIDKQIKGWETKTGLTLSTTLARGVQTPSQQEKEEGKEQLQEQEEVKGEEEFNSDAKDAIATVDFSAFNISSIEIYWKDWKEYKFNQHKEKFKTLKTEQVAVNKLGELSNWNADKAKRIIEQSMSNLWKGLFELKQQNNNANGTGTKQPIDWEERDRKFVERVMGTGQIDASSERDNDEPFTSFEDA